MNTARLGFSRTIGFVGQPAVALNPLAADKTLGPAFQIGSETVAARPAPILNGNGLSEMQGSLGSQTLNRHFQNSYQFMMTHS